jgi:hypothetical protein
MSLSKGRAENVPGYLDAREERSVMIHIKKNEIGGTCSMDSEAPLRLVKSVLQGREHSVEGAACPTALHWSASIARSWDCRA